MSGVRARAAWAAALCLWPGVCRADSAGTVSGKFLSLGVGGAAIAMGETGVGLSRGVYAAYWNPAGLALMPSPEAAFMHNQFFESINQQYLAYAHPSRWGTAAVAVTRLGMDPIASYDAAGARRGDVEAADTSAGFSFGRLLTQSFAVGAGLKMVQERLGPVTADTWASDLGLIWRVPDAGLPERLGELHLGAGYANLGPGLKFDQERFPLHETLRVGLGLKTKLAARPLIVGLDGVRPNDGEAFAAAGFQWQPVDFLAARAGFRSGQDIGSGLRFGVGFYIKAVSVDYAWAGFGDLGAAHRMSVQFRFGRPQRAQLSLIRGAPMIKEITVVPPVSYRFGQPKTLPWDAALKTPAPASAVGASGVEAKSPEAAKPARAASAPAVVSPQERGIQHAVATPDMAGARSARRAPGLLIAMAALLAGFLWFKRRRKR
ncbi:MAG: PorV/PorQ family protein [Elusimicrobia bacterium]|nr:PorV/PorQ family protein [Elusimicrobiota bacterium]